MSELPFTLLIIIGAGRSGTNVLRDSLCRLRGFATWDCDEINPVWRHGNLMVPHDALTPEHARPEVIRFLRKAFLKTWRRLGEPRFLVEKTCANSLRVPFVDAAFPEARYLFLVRDGVDVVASAQKRWRGEMEIASLPYLAAKACHTPLLDLPVYGFRFLQSRLQLFGGKLGHMSIWGPRFPGMDDFARGASLLELCARQWAESVAASAAAFDAMPSAKVHLLRYEDFAKAPAGALSDIAEFLEAPIRQPELAAAAGPVSTRSIGKGRAGLAGEADKLMAIMGAQLARFGYGAMI